MVASKGFGAVCVCVSSVNQYCGGVIFLCSSAVWVTCTPCSWCVFGECCSSGWWVIQLSDSPQASCSVRSISSLLPRPFVPYSLSALNKHSPTVILVCRLSISTRTLFRITAARATIIYVKPMSNTMDVPERHRRQWGNDLKVYCIFLYYHRGTISNA